MTKSPPLFALFLFATGATLLSACASRPRHLDSPPPSTSSGAPAPGHARASAPSLLPVESPLTGKTIVLDPGHGGTADTDHYRVGPAGEREEWINLRVALFLRPLIEARGGRVLMPRETDVPVELRDRADLAVENEADAFLSIHHNATADRSVNFPIVYYHGNASGNAASVALGTALARHLAEALYETRPPVSVVSDHVIFPGAGAAVLRHSFGIPGVIVEASFFSNPEEERRLTDPEYNRREAEAYARALEAFFSEPPPPILDRYEGGRIPPLETLQEAERMDETAKRWMEDYESGMEMMRRIETTRGRRGEILALQRQATHFFARSARSLPDSPVARHCHARLADLYTAAGNQEEATNARRRVEEYYALNGWDW